MSIIKNTQKINGWVTLNYAFIIVHVYIFGPSFKCEMKVTCRCAISYHHNLLGKYFLKATNGGLMGTQHCATLIYVL